MSYNQRYCFICGSTRQIEKHHIFVGPLRKKSDLYGLTVDLCHFCHNDPPNGVHFNKDKTLELKQYGQRKVMAEQRWTTEKFIEEFRKNYL